MPLSELRLIKRCAEHLEKSEIKNLKKGIRGIYVLLKNRPRLNSFDVIYIGMAKRNIRSRIQSHSNKPKKSKLWTHFSVFEVWDNITDVEIEELEGLFRHLYKRDSRANMLNKQKRYHKLFKIKNNNLSEW